MCPSARLLVLPLLLGLGACHHAVDPPDLPRVVLETRLGNIEIEVDVERAPVSGASFLLGVDGGYYQDAAFYRTVSPANDNGSPPISVIQGGLMSEVDPLPAVRHESTKETGLRHLDGTVSLARAAPGTASGSTIFICIGDQPALDFGGKRNADGLGFAAFGTVVNGIDVVRRIHQMDASGPSESAYMAGQMLAEPVEILSVRRARK